LLKLFLEILRLMLLNNGEYFAPIIGPINFSHLNIYYQSIENMNELLKRLELRNLNPYTELPRIINKALKLNYLNKGIFSFYEPNRKIICVLSRDTLNEFNVDSYNILLSEPKILSPEIYKVILDDFLMNYLNWKLGKSSLIVSRVSDGFYLDEVIVGKSKEGLTFTLLRGFGFRVINHPSGLYIYLFSKFLPRIKPTLDKILSLDIFRGTYEYIRGEYYWDGLLKNMSCITVDDYSKLGKPSYAGRINKVVYPDSPIYDELMSSIREYYSKESSDVKEFIESKIYERVPIVLTYKGKKSQLLLSYLSNILYIAPSIEELKMILDVLGFKQILRWYIDQVNPKITDFVRNIEKWLMIIKEALEELPLTEEIKITQMR